MRVIKTGIRFIAQNYDIETGKILEEIILREEKLLKAEKLEELGYLHVEQIDLIQKAQDFKIKHQIVLNHLTSCPVCGSKSNKRGVLASEFHAALTDHKVFIQRSICKCGWISRSSIEGMYGSCIHPDLLKKQALQGSKESYKKSSISLDAESASKRAINSHSQIFKTVKLVGESLEEIKISEDYGITEDKAMTLIANIDGGHIKARGDKRSFEAMIATVYRPENLQYVNKDHNIITSKTCVASSKDDAQVTMKSLFKSACRAQGMNKDTEVTVLADGAENCWSIANAINKDCKKTNFILDWFHIAMKFKNIAIAQEHKELFEKVKWHLWHGHPEQALIRLDELKLLIIDNDILTKLDKLYTYISNNKTSIVNYEMRKKLGLVFTSNLAEATVNTLINERQKGKQKMLWGRDGAHNILQIRSSVASKSWQKDWKKVESNIYKIAA
jgi:hypothetical protein